MTTIDPEANIELQRTEDAEIDRSRCRKRTSSSMGQTTSKMTTVQLSSDELRI